MLIIVITILDLYIFQAQKWGEKMEKGKIKVFMGGGRKNPAIMYISNAKKNNEIFIKILKLNKSCL